MAFLVKNRVKEPGGDAVISQLIHVSRGTQTIPESTTEILFRVHNGRVLVHKLIGEVTTVIQTQTDNLKVTGKALNDASAAVGTAVDVASNKDITGLEVGGSVFVEGDGTALVQSNAGNVLIGANSGNWVMPQGEIYITTSATNTGAMKWDIWYQPLDKDAYVLDNAVQAAI